jgi:dynactin complex subunit
VENWIDTYTATEISKKLKELITQYKNGIVLDSDEEIIIEVIKSEIITGTEKEKDRELIRLRAANDTLKQANNLLREKNKQLTAKLI